MKIGSIQLRYSTVEKECLAIKLGIETFQNLFTRKTFYSPDRLPSLGVARQAKREEWKVNTMEPEPAAIHIFCGTQIGYIKRKCRLAFSGDNWVNRQVCWERRREECKRSRTRDEALPRPEGFKSPSYYLNHLYHWSSLLVTDSCLLLRSIYSLVF